MKTSIKFLSVLGCAYAMATVSLFAQVYTIDEFGNSSGPGISPGVMQPDPSGGLAANVMVYNLSFPVVPGDLWLTNGVEGLSDVVRFWNPNPASGNSSQIIFYSDFSTADPADSPADTGLPQNSLPILSIKEVGPEGNNGALYTPPAGGPGSVAGAIGLQYNIISDVPEPSAVALTIVGAGLLFLTLKPRHQTNIN